MNTKPISEHDYRVHALNIHGIFFERWCQHTIAQAPGWTIKRTNYPVAFSVPNAPYTASALDIWAEFKRDDAIFTLPIECKKHNPELASWIFFQHRHPTMSQYGGSPYVTRIDNTLKQAPNNGWDATIRIAPLVTFSCVCTDEAREIRSSYLDYKKNSGNLNQLTKTTNHAITDACQQIALGTKAVINDMNIYNAALSKKNDPSFPMPFKWQIFLPAIVTTAKLYSCNFDFTDIDATTGEIPFDKVKINEHPYLLFEYPLPRFLQPTPQDMVPLFTSDVYESFIRLDILIINSNAFLDVLSKLASMFI